jgi:signal transduction histidine kinase
MQPQFRAISIQDWLSVILRWVLVCSAAWALSVSGEVSIPESLVLLAAIVYNAVLTLLAAFQRRIYLHSLLVILIDTLIAQSLAYLSLGAGSLSAWIGLMPVLSAGLFHLLPGALLASVLNLGVQISLTWLAHGSSALAALLPIGALHLSLAVVIGLVARQVNHIAEKSSQHQLRLQKKAEQVESERRRSIYKMLLALSATLNYERVLEEALDLSAAGWGDDQDHLLVSAAMMYSQDALGATDLRVATCRRFTPADARIVLQGASGLIGRAIDGGEPQLAHDIASDPELSRIVALRACQVVYCIPLRTGLDTYGVLLFAHPDQDYFSLDRREYLDAIANQAMVALQNARLYRDLEQEKERVTAIEEDARKKLARDLHDGPTQSVAAIAMRVNLARRIFERDAVISTEELFKIEELARRTTKEIRHMLFTLRPLVLESHGLAPALQAMAEKMKETYDQNVLVEADGELISNLDLGKQGVIFAIAEEAVNNARKHAHAKLIQVRLMAAGQGLALLVVEDNGTGFDPTSIDSGYENRGSLGMVNMRERAELINGYFQVESAVGHGTRVSLVIPLTAEAADRLRRGNAAAVS